MPKISLKVQGIGRQRAISTLIVALAFAALPIFTLSSHRNDIYVDADATGTHNGSMEHPYTTINEALEHANKRTDIHVANGSYKENFTIKKGVKIFGESRDGVVITAKDDDYAVARMKDDTTINKVTLKGGKWGIEVNNDSKVSIIKCKVKNNDKDGIHIESDNVDKVSISKSEISNNGRAGIYSKKRKLSITDNEIFGNDSNGIDLEAGSSAWIADNKIKDNGGSGLKVRIDGSNIWTDDNTFRDNRREGMEVLFKGMAGKVNIKDATFKNNGRYGIVRAQSFPIAASSKALWAKYLTFQGENKLYGNDGGNISAIIVRN